MIHHFVQFYQANRSEGHTEIFCSGKVTPSNLAQTLWPQEFDGRKQSCEAHKTVMDILK